MEKRLIIAIALSIFIILAFQTLAPKPPVPPSAPIVASVATPTVNNTGEAAISAVTPAETVKQESELEVDTGKYIITFSNIGGAIKNIMLKDFRNADNGEPLKLVTIYNPKYYIGNMSSAVAGISDTAAYSLQRSDDVITYSLKTKDFEITKKYNLRNYQYGMELEIIGKNISPSREEL
jgi:YidC/Oxa1 family membrane protein insertase